MEKQLTRTWKAITELNDDRQGGNVYLEHVYRCQL